jgi:hypothetical protein
MLLEIGNSSVRDNLSNMTKEITVRDGYETF